MTQRFHSSARSGGRRRLPAQARQALQPVADAEPLSVMDRFRSLQYMAVSLLVVAAACAIAAGEPANAELQLASMAIAAASHPQGICAARGKLQSVATKPECLVVRGDANDASGAC